MPQDLCNAHYLIKPDTLLYGHMHEIQMKNGSECHLFICLKTYICKMLNFYELSNASLAHRQCRTEFAHPGWEKIPSNLSKIYIQYETLQIDNTAIPFFMIQIDETHWIFELTYNSITAVAANLLRLITHNFNNSKVMTFQSSGQNFCVKKVLFRKSGHIYAI